MYSITQSLISIIFIVMFFSSHLMKTNDYLNEYIISNFYNLKKM